MGSSIGASLAHGTYAIGRSGGTTSSFNSTGGNWIGLGISSTGNTLTGAISDNMGNTYVLATSYSDPGNSLYMYYFVAENATCGSGHTITYSPVFPDAVGFAYDVRAGVATSGSYDSPSYASSTNNGVTSHSVGPTTPTNDGSLLVLLGIHNVGFPSLVSGGGFTTIQDDDPGIGNVNLPLFVATVIQDAKASSSPTATGTAPSAGIIDLLLFAINAASYSSGDILFAQSIF